MKYIGDEPRGNGLLEGSRDSMLACHNFESLCAKDHMASRIHKSEKEHSFRTKFERDRDRILYSRAFRRLSGKTQVFIPSFDDHVRTRLTHTLEVSQIARTIGKRLNLNMPLLEAISLGHDIGHTPFGHVAERTLNHIMNGCDNIRDFNKNISDKSKGFKHNWQSIRIVADLEKIYDSFNGLNLTDYTLWGILNHSKLNYRKCDKTYGVGGDKCGLSIDPNIKCKPDMSLSFYDQYNYLFKETSWTIEGLVVNFADEIAQRHHDIEDGIEAKIINKDELVAKISEIFDPIKEDYKSQFKKLEEAKEKLYYLPRFSGLIVNMLVTELIENTKNNLEKFCVKYGLNKNNILNDEVKIEAFKSGDYFGLVGFSLEFSKKEKQFQDFLKMRILNSFDAQRMDGRSQLIVRKLFKAYLTNPQQLPNAYIVKLFESIYKENYLKQVKRTYHTPEELHGRLRNRLLEYHRDLENDEYKINLLRTITDYISSMTDQYAVKQFRELYGQI